MRSTRATESTSGEQTKRATSSSQPSTPISGSAHDAAEARFESLIKRKRLPDAAVVAKEARYRSIQCMIEVGRYIAETKRDYRRAGWHEQIPTRLGEMVEHLKGCMDIERRRLAAMRETRDEAVREDHRRQAAELVINVEDCFARHNALHVQLMRAEQAFFEEQDRQAFAWTLSTRGTRDITDEILVPLLERPIRLAGPLIAGFAVRLWPPKAPVVARLGSALDLLLRAPAERALLGEEIESLEYDGPPRILGSSMMARARSWSGSSKRWTLTRRPSDTPPSPTAHEPRAATLPGISSSCAF